MQRYTDKCEINSFFVTNAVVIKNFKRSRHSREGGNPPIYPDRLNPSATLRVNSVEIDEARSEPCLNKGLKAPNIPAQRQRLGL